MKTDVIDQIDTTPNSLSLISHLSLERYDRVIEIIDLLKQGYRRPEIVQKMADDYGLSVSMTEKDLKLCRKVLQEQFREQQEAQAGLSLERYNDWIRECDNISDWGKRLEQKRLLNTRIDVITGVERQPGDIHIEQLNVFQAFPQSIEQQFTEAEYSIDSDTDTVPDDS